MLKKLRVITSLLVIIFITLFFINDSDFININLSFLPKIQFIPSLLSLSLIIIAVIILLTFLFGRIYCAILCPLGIFQDVIIKISSLFKKKKNRKFKYRKANNILRYAILIGTIIAFFAGLSIIVALLDPYSAYGRIAVYIFKPIVLGINNGLTTIMMKLNVQGMYYYDNAIPSIGAFIIAIITLFVIAFMATFYGRQYCNTVCPVGTFLGLISKYSLFKIRIDENACTSCTLCSNKCKASCIDAQNKTIDNSRCVLCFNCLDASCKNAGIKYKLKNKKAKEKPAVETVDEQKRTLLTTVATGALLGLATTAQAKILPKSITDVPKKTPISPPGSKSIARFNKMCTSCNLCVTKCPTNILKPTLFDYGLEGILQPTIKFDRGYCSYDCNLCSEVCPTGAILPLTLEEKQRTQIGKAVFVKEDCRRYPSGRGCGICINSCPTDALKMVRQPDGITLPEVNTDLCIGCGACEYDCPMKIKAIFVVGNKEHRIVKTIKN